MPPELLPTLWRRVAMDFVKEYVVQLSSSFRLDRESAALLVIDIQERLSAVMHSENMQAVTKNALALIEGAKALDMPLWLTEQYPQGIGPTLPAVLESLPVGVERFAKKDFSCAAVQGVRDGVSQSGRKQLIVCGMEAHICVFQTVRDFIGFGYEVYVPQDAVISRTVENREVGLRLMERAGAVISSTESVLFDLLRRAEGPEFKLISRLIK